MIQWWMSSPFSSRIPDHSLALGEPVRVLGRILADLWYFWCRWGARSTYENTRQLVYFDHFDLCCYHDYVFYIFSCGIWRKCRMAKPVHLRRARSILVLFSCEVMRTVKHIATTLAKGFASDEQVGSWEIRRFAISTGANWCGERVGYLFFKP